MCEYRSGVFELPPEVDASLCLGKWRYWTRMASPFKSKEKDGRVVPAEWVSTGHYPMSGKGVYIWLAKRPSSDGWRFVHVGISAKGASSLAKRTVAHMRNQFTVDRVHELKSDNCGLGLGSLGPPIEDGDQGDKRFEVACQFLGSLRVLYLVPDESEGVDPERIRKLEGVIARAASYLFNRKGTIRGVNDRELEITNTLGRVARYDFADRERHFVEVAKALNRIEPMLPDARMSWPAGMT